MIDVSSLLAVAIPLIVLVGGMGMMLVALHGRQRLKELAIQERIAMIDKGLVPSPETNPAAFESMLRPPRASTRALRYRSAGLVLTGMGLALTVLLFFVMPRAARGIALGVGGALTIVGFTILGNGLLLANDDVEGSERNTTARG